MGTDGGDLPLAPAERAAQPRTGPNAKLKRRNWILARRKPARKKPASGRKREAGAPPSGGQEVASAMASQALYDDGVLRITVEGSPPAVTLTGEIDESTYRGLLAALSSTAGAREIHVDLRAVEFCDLAGLRAIVQLSQEPANGGSSPHVVLHSLPAPMRSLLQILGWDATPGLSVD